MTLKNEKNVDIQVISPGPKGSLSIRPSYGVRGEEIFFFSPFPQKRLILRLTKRGISYIP